MNDNSNASKKIKFGAIVLLGINCLIGAGIFLTPGRAYADLGMNVFWILGVCAVLAIIIGLAFAEMAGKFSRTGGVYVYVYEAFGPFLGFNVGFMRFLAACVALAVQMVALPNLIQTATNGAFVPSPMTNAIISVVFCAILCGINLITVKVTSYAISFVSWLVLAILIICIAVTATHVDFNNFSYVPGLTAQSGQLVPPLGTLTGAEFSAGFLLLFYAFVGFENIGVAAQDMENPTRNIPRAIIYVLIIVTIIYALLFFGIIGVMGGSRLVVSNDSVADGVAMILGPIGNWVISIGAIIALCGIGLAMSFAGPRNLVPLAVDHFLPEQAGSNNARGVPAQSIVIMFIVTTIFIVVANVLSSQSFTLLVGVATICRLLQYLAVIIGLYPVRKRDLPGTYKMPFAHVLIPIAVLVCILLGFETSLMILGLTVALIIVSLIVYYLYAKPRYQKHHKVKRTRKAPSQ